MIKMEQKVMEILQVEEVLRKLHNGTMLTISL